MAEEKKSETFDIRESLFTLLVTICYAKKKLLLSGLFLIGASLTVASFFVEKEYTTTSAFQVNSQSSAKLPIPEGLKMLSTKFTSNKGLGIIEGILKSRKLSMTMLNSYNLKEVYDTKWEHKAIEEFRENFIFDVDESGIVDFQFTYPHQDSVKLIADSIISYVNKESIVFGVKKAKLEFDFNKLVFDSVIAIIDSLTEDVIGILSETGMIDFEVQVRFSLEIFKTLEQSLIEAQNAYSKAKYENSMTPSEMKSLQNMIANIKKRQKKLSTLYPSKSKEDRYSFGLNYDSIPQLRAHLRKVEFQLDKNKKLLKILIPMLEESRMRMIQTTPVINLIDPPYVPPYKSYPKKSLIIILGTLLFGLPFVIFVVIREMFTNPVYKTEQIEYLFKVGKAIKKPDGNQ